LGRPGRPAEGQQAAKKIGFKVVDLLKMQRQNAAWLDQALNLLILLLFPV
jgi:hypothetical protein